MSTPTLKRMSIGFSEMVIPATMVSSIAGQLRPLRQPMAAATAAPKQSAIWLGP